MPLIPFPYSIFIGLAGYSSACLGAGFLILGILSRTLRPLTSQTAGVRLATSFVLGQGFLASIWLLLALGRSFSRPVVIPILVVFALAGLEFIRRDGAPLMRQVVSIWRRLREDTWGWQGLAGFSIVLCLAWLTSIGRPLNVDAAALYMALPKVVAASHRLVPLPGYESFGDVGMQGEMHYAVFMLFKVPDAARLFPWTAFLAAAYLLATLARRCGLGPRGQWLTLATMVSSSAVIYLSFDGKVDMFAVPLGLSAYYWILQIRDEHKQVATWLTGLFSGFALVAKISYLPVLAPGLVFLLIWQFYADLRDPVERKQAIKIVVANGLWIAAGVVIAVTPHLVKNYLLYNNPISPFGTGSSWATQPWYGSSVTRRIILTYPLALTYGNYFAQYGNLSPLWLAFLPMIFLLPKPRPFFPNPLAGITLAALLGMTSWIIINPSNLAPRYYLAPLLLFILLPARAAEHVSYTDQRPRWLAFLVLCATYTTFFTTSLYFLTETFFPGRTYRYLSGEMSECARDSSFYCKGMFVLNKAARNGERVFLASYHRYWLRPDLLQCLSSNAEYAEFLGTSPDQKWVFMYERGFHYLFLDKTTFGTMMESLDIENPPNWVRPKLLYSSGDNSIAVYHLRYVAPPANRVFECSQIVPPAWNVIRP